MQPKGCIDLAGAATKALPDQNQSFCFQISGPRCARDYVLAATSGAEMSRWMRLLDAFGAAVDPATRKESVAAAPAEEEEEEEG